MVNKKEQRFLLQLARNAIITYPKHYTLFNLNIPNILKEKKGVFVSLYINNKLRGCVGYTIPYASLYQSVIENAVNAAYYDSRFPILTKNELDKLKIEISLLTDPVRLDYIDAYHLLKKLDSKEGLIIKKGLRIATFLPQVWKQIKDKERFLAHLCFKANLNEMAWKDSDVEIYTYKVERFDD